MLFFPLAHDFHGVSATLARGVPLELVGAGPFEIEDPDAQRLVLKVFPHALSTSPSAGFEASALDDTTILGEWVLG